MLLNTERPHSTALTMERKLSSRMTMSAASLATCRQRTRQFRVLLAAEWRGRDTEPRWVEHLRLTSQSGDAAVQERIELWMQRLI